MNEKLRYGLAGLLSGVMAFTATITGALMEMPTESGIDAISGVTWLIASMFGLGAAAKDWRHFLTKESTK